ncbi:NADPH-dependent FMN reductase [Embleya scabrispora]|uniref:NADPH-dependent FMN reductase n=1 Tax=Embleya scabrispora TaxID=159449 RepID=UPI001F3475D6|nr:NADPH-dependent FMN reductase [Embleya scabrispora]
MTANRRVLVISGSLRAESTNSAVVRTASVVAPDGVDAVVFAGLAELPHFNPDDDHEPLPPAVVALRAAIEDADAVLFSTPEYAGALPGSFKNLLDWTVGGVETSDKPVGWINASTNPGGAAKAHESLRTVLGYTGADVIDAACVRLGVARDGIAPDGLIADPEVREGITAVLTVLAEAARLTRT